MEYRLRIEQDEDPTSPEEWDSPVFLVTTDNRYFTPKAPDGWDLGRAKRAASGKEEGYKAFPLFAYIHSGVALSMGAFSCPWDSGQIGYVVVEQAGLGEHSKPEEAAEAVIEEWNQYLSGDVWGYIVERVETCNMGHQHTEQVDSCWGFYGQEMAEEEGAAALAYFQKEAV